MSQASLVRNRRRIVLGVGLAVTFLALAPSTRNGPGIQQALGNMFREDADAVLCLASQVGFTPEVALALNMDEQAQRNALATIRGWHAVHATHLDVATAQVAESLASERALVSKVIRGGTRQDREALAAARVQTALALSNLTVLEDGLLAALRATMTPGQQSGFSSIVANSGVDVPVAYRMAERPADDWIRLRDALLERDAADRDGRELAQTTRDLLAMVESEPATAAAVTIDPTLLPAVESLWRTELGI